MIVKQGPELSNILITTVADNFFSVFFREIRLYISCESSASDSNEMKSLIFPEKLFEKKKKKKKRNMWFA